MEKAIGKPLELPDSIAQILDKESRCELMDADRNQIQDFLKNTLYKHTLHR